MLLIGSTVFASKLVHEERFGTVFLLLLPVLLIAEFFSPAGIVNFVVAHWNYALFALAVYFCCGFPWFYFYEWERYLPDEYERRQEVLKKLSEDERALLHIFRNLDLIGDFIEYDLVKGTEEVGQSINIKIEEHLSTNAEGLARVESLGELLVELDGKLGCQERPEVLLKELAMLQSRVLDY